MKKQIENWFRTNNNHACDDQRFFDIVIDSFNSKIDYQCFADAIQDVNKSISENEIYKIYIKYETLYNFMVFFHNQK